MRTNTISTYWDNPQPIDDVIDNVPDNKIGLYYITRRFNGKESSLYMGESVNSIKNRLRSHKNWVHEYSHSQIFVRIGTIVYPSQNIENAIRHAEKALIFLHGQYGTKILVENTVSTKVYSYTDIFRIINEGNRFELGEEVDMNKHEDI